MTNMMNLDPKPECSGQLASHAAGNALPEQSLPDGMHEYTLDVTLMSTIRVKAHSVAAARQQLRDHVDGASANLGAWPNGEPILCEVSLEGEADLDQIDGEPA